MIRPPVRTGGAAADEQIVLVDDDGRPIGTTSKALVHGADTPLHLAFSCYVFDEGGRLLVTRRSSRKRTWPGYWTNSFCGHPGPGEDLVAAVHRRAAFELGLTLDGVEIVLPHFRYRAVERGIAENEICPVTAGRLEGDEPEPEPEPTEVEDWRWIRWESVGELIRERREAVSPWFAAQHRLLTRDGWSPAAFSAGPGHRT